MQSTCNMKVAFLGKGGSGKSTLATHAVKYLHGSGYSVLAIDADHNMDLSFNLGATGEESFLGSDPGLIKEHLGVSREATFAEALKQGSLENIRFRIDPPDPFTSRIATQLSERLSLITAGPHTDAVRYGGDCSHSLSAPLKVYLPLLSLASRQAVVIDERAGTDPVATGILEGVDRAVIVVEPTVHSVRVARQISEELTLAGVPHMFAANKAGDEDAAIFEPLPFPPSARIPFSKGADGVEEAMHMLFSESFA
jgi:CO dehydrogenase maturation factor